VLLEAMAVGCPVLATAVGGIPAPGDVAAAARSILALVRDPDRATPMREAARARAEQYPLRFMVDGVCGVYAEALARRDSHE
jgi:glycosyltransferase involved in cell wall biosynthesis